MRIRTVKPEFWESESLARCVRDARLLFIGLFNLADDAGIFRASPVFISGRIFPYDEGITAQVEIWLQQLAMENCIHLYEIGGNRYGKITNFHRHQKIDKPTKSRLPLPDNSGRILRPVGEGYVGDMDQGSGIRDQGMDQGSGNGSGKGSGDRAAATPPSGEASPPPPPQKPGLGKKPEPPEKPDSGVVGGVHPPSTPPSSETPENHPSDRLNGSKPVTTPKSKGSKTRFQPPEESDLVAFCKSVWGLEGDEIQVRHVNEFLDHYRANGWKVGGKAPMRDWQAAWRNWVRRIGTFDPPAHAGRRR